MNSNALTNKQLSNLRVFKDEHHNLDAQKPVLLDFGSENKKNKVI
jgi:ribosomal protein L13